MIPFHINAVGCDWTLVSLGRDGTDWPENARDIDGGTWPNFNEDDAYEREDWYFDHIGFVLRFDPDSLDIESGWYFVFADVVAVEPAALDRNVYSFKIYVRSLVDEE